MDLPTEGIPHIPDDWTREPVRAKTKSVTSKQANNTGGTTGATSKNAATTTKTVRKRKRNTCAVASTATIPTTTPIDDSNILDDILMPGSRDNASNTAMAQTSTNTEIPSTTTTVEIPQISTIPQRYCDETESVIRGLYHQVEKLARRPGCALQDGIYLDSIMTHIPYTDVLEQMFGGNEVTDTACVPVVTRAYEESYMREILGSNEKPCIMGGNCECQFVDEHNPFIGVQFTLPVEAFSSAAATSDMIEELSSNKLCVLCCRKNTQSLFYEALYNHRAYSSCIQLYGNICDRPGEYAKEAMLICPLSGPIQNMPLPVVAHQRNRYSVVDYNGVRQLRQHRVGYEDFHAPSSSRY